MHEKPPNFGAVCLIKLESEDMNPVKLKVTPKRNQNRYIVFNLIKHNYN